MLPPETILEKTEKGQEELRTRKYKVAAKTRMLLLLVDGKQPVSVLRGQMATMNLTDAMLESLLDEGFLRTRGEATGESAPGTGTGAEVTEGVSAYGAARRLMNESVFNALGLKAFFFTLKIEKSSNMEDLRALLPEYEQVMSKALGAEAADLFVKRLHELIGV